MKWWLLVSLVAVSPVLAGETATPQKVVFAAADEVSLTGLLYGAGPTGVVLTHMYPAAKESWDGLARFLADKGFTCLAFDCRGYGESSGEKETGKIDRDVAAALKYLQEKKSLSRIFLIGASMGGTASLIVAAQTPVAGVISISGPEVFRGLDARAAAGQVTAPKLFVVSKEDKLAAQSAQSLYDKAKEPKQLLILEGNEHGTAIFSSLNGERLRQTILDFMTPSQPAAPQK